MKYLKSLDELVVSDLHRNRITLMSDLIVWWTLIPIVIGISMAARDDKRWWRWLRAKFTRRRIKNRER